MLLRSISDDVIYYGFSYTIRRILQMSLKDLLVWLQKFEDDDCGIPSVVSDQMEYGIPIHGDKGTIFYREVLFTTTLSNLHVENFNAFNNGAWRRDCDYEFILEQSSEQILFFLQRIIMEIIQFLLRFNQVPQYSQHTSYSYILNRDATSRPNFLAWIFNWLDCLLIYKTSPLTHFFVGSWTSLTFHEVSFLYGWMLEIW